MYVCFIWFAAFLLNSHICQYVVDIVHCFRFNLLSRLFFLFGFPSFIHFNFLFFLFEITLLEFDTVIDNAIDNFFGCHCVACRERRNEFSMVLPNNRFLKYFSRTETLTGINRNKFAHHFWYSIWIVSSIFQWQLSLAMTHNIHLEVVHQVFGY